MLNDSPSFIRSLVVLTLFFPAFAQESTEDQTRKVIEQFERARNERDLKSIEAIVAPDIVVLENGHRNQGWADFRDNHLIPEMKEPGTPGKSELIRVKSGSEMGWAYTKTETTITRRTGEKIMILLWSTYFVEKRDRAWKIAFLDWSSRPLKSSQKEAPLGSQASESRGKSSWKVEELEKRFRDAGLKVRRDVVVRQPFLSPTGRVLVIGDGEAEVQTYIYTNEESRARDTAKLGSEKVAPPTMQVGWLMPATLITDRNLAVILLTRNAALRAKIKYLVEFKR